MSLNALLNRPEQDPFWRRLLKSPTETLAKSLYALRASSTSSPSPSPLSSPSPSSKTQAKPPLHVVCISDTHNTTPSVSDGDILIHAGDLTQSGSRRELEAQIAWLDAQPHRFKVVVAGNHEICLDSGFTQSRPATSSKVESVLAEGDAHGDGDGEPIDWKSLIYLQNTSTTLDIDSAREVKVFGSPYTPKHGNWAFQYPRARTEIWGEIGIPNDTDILITHGPPRAHLDLGFMGCEGLRSFLWGMQRKPLLHVFGHVHGGYGREIAMWDVFQRAYEGVLGGRSWVARWIWLAVLLWYGLIGVLTGWSGPRRKTVMVNAAAVGGVRDEKRREAICVDI
ncbi:Metallo-dependent phosphatase-like protein [Aspergillus carlsbadensis]|nr:Metallo-dependent phosphatase-like protein [Aspergillus carlsbadensis]